jgi:hypothetical protein
VVGYLLDRSPEILFLGGGGNALITCCFYLWPALRTTLFFVLWAALGAGSVFVANFQDREERAREPKPWRTLVALQLLYVAVAWIVLTRS